MRLVLAAVLLGLASPVFAQTATPGAVSPMTGTTAAPPTAAAPATTTAPARPHRARHTRQTMQQRFDAANSTHDGKLTLDQAKAGKLNRIVTNFDAIDSGKKGYVTMDDLHAYNRARRAARKPAAQ